MDIFEYASKCKDMLKPEGKIDVLLYYGCVVPALSRYLKTKEIAAKNWMGKSAFSPYLIKRGSKIRTLFAKDFASITPGFMKLRSENHLDDVKKKLDDKQALVWEYFLPRKLSDLFYATNNEGAGKPIERIFIDIDRGDVSAKLTQKATKKLVEEIQADDLFWKSFKGDLSVMWTGNSFHIYIFLDKPATHDDYDNKISFTKKDPLNSFIGRWAQKVNNSLGLKVVAGHERVKDAINIDPSQTPSGKLCRAPFSLHMKDEKTVDGIAVPITIDMLEDTSLVNTLNKLDPKKVIQDLDVFLKSFPKKFI